MNPYDLNRRLEVVFDDLLGDQSLRGKRVLDVGCGTGPFSLAAGQRGADVVSLDIGVQLLHRARAKGVTRVVAGDAATLPFPTDEFDIVLSSECLEHTPDPERVVAEMLRVLRPGGRLVVTCPNRLWRWSVVVAGALESPALSWTRELARLDHARALGSRAWRRHGPAGWPPYVPVCPDLHASAPAECSIDLAQRWDRSTSTRRSRRSRHRRAASDAVGDELRNHSRAAAGYSRANPSGSGTEPPASSVCHFQTPLILS